MPPPDDKPVVSVTDPPDDPAPHDGSVPAVAASKTKRFVKPSLRELFEAFNGRIPNPGFEAEKFLNHYEANGWRVGRNPMKSWPHAVSNWITNHSGRDPPRPRPLTQDPERLVRRLTDTSWANEAGGVSDEFLDSQNGCGDDR